VITNFCSKKELAKLKAEHTYVHFEGRCQESRLTIPWSGGFGEHLQELQMLHLLDHCHSCGIHMGLHMCSIPVHPIPMSMHALLFHSVQP
jgi:hypothetical protein